MTRSTTERHSLSHEDIHKAIVEFCGGEPAERGDWKVRIQPAPDKSGEFLATAELTHYEET